MTDAAWKGLPREVVEWFIDRHMPVVQAGSLPEGRHIIDGLGLRCVGWHDWTGDPTTSMPLFVMDEWPHGTDLLWKPE